MPTVEAAITRAADCVETFVREGVEIAMNRFNTEPSASKTAKATPGGVPAHRGEEENS
jgi:hypothetical protein